jgi:uncharacterized protein
MGYMTKKTISRRSFLKRFTYSFLGLFGIGGGTYYYSKHLEPSMLSVKEEQIYSPKIPTNFENIKILQFSDTHLGFHYELSQLEKLVDKINEQTPDIVLFTGDLVDAPNQYPLENYETCIALLSRIKAPFGKFWIYGNHDHGGYGTETIRDVMNFSGFQLLLNEHFPITIENSSINLVGLDDLMLGRPNLDIALQNMNSELFTILMCHEPDYADETAHYPVDVQFSGHSHGGQIQIPLIGYVITPPFAEKYVEGKYVLGSQPLQLFVSRGLGTTRLPYRFLCKPEINVYTLHQGTNNSNE